MKNNVCFTIIVCIAMFFIVASFTHLFSKGNQVESEIEHRLGSVAFTEIQHSDQASLCYRNKQRFSLSENEKSLLINLILNDNSFMLEERKKCPFIEECCISFNGEEKFKVLFSPSGRQLRFLVNGTKVTVDYDPAAKEIHSLLSSITKGAYL